MSALGIERRAVSGALGKHPVGDGRGVHDRPVCASSKRTCGHEREE